MEIDILYIVGYAIIYRNMLDSTECEQEMKSRKMAFAAVFKIQVIGSSCQVYENYIFEFPVDVRIVTSYFGLPATTFVKTAGHTGNVYFFSIYL